MANGQDVILEADVPPVDNVIPIAELLPKIAEGLAEQVRKAEADPKVPPEAEEKFKAAARHARQLSQQLKQAETLVPQFPLFARPRPGGGPGRPGGGPGRPGGGPRRPGRP